MAFVNLGRRLFLNFRRADVIFVLDNQEIPAHRLVLGEACPYFDKLLWGDFEESKSKRVPMTGTSAKVFKEVMRFIYLEQLEIHNWKIEDILALLSSAHEYQLEQLIDAVTKALETKHLDFNSWELVKSAASLYDSDALKAISVSFVETKIDNFLRYKDLEKFTPDFIHSMLDSPKIVSCNQDHFLFAICEWSNKHKLADVSSMLSKINWSIVSPAINQVILRDMFSNVENVQGFTFWTKLEEMKKELEVVANVESVHLVKSSNVEFALEEYQCSIVFNLGYFINYNFIFIHFSKGNNAFVELPVKGIEFESTVKFNVSRIYGCNLKFQNSDMVASEHMLNIGLFKYSGVFSAATLVSGIYIVNQHVVQLNQIKLQNLVIR